MTNQLHYEIKCLDTRQNWTWTLGEHGWIAIPFRTLGFLEMSDALQVFQNILKSDDKNYKLDFISSNMVSYIESSTGQTYDAFTGKELN